MTRQGDRPTVFGQRPWLNKEGREIANRAARKIHRQKQTDPDKSTDSDLYLGDVLAWLDGGGQTDPEADLLTGLLKDGLNYQEAVYWYLWNYAALTPKEIHLSETGREHADSWDTERIEVRSIEATLTAAGRKRGRKGHVSDWDRQPDSDLSDGADGR